MLQDPGYGTRSCSASQLNTAHMMWIQHHNEQCGLCMTIPRACMFCQGSS